MHVSMLMPVGVPNVEYTTPVGCETRIRDVICKTYSSTGPRCNCTLSLGHTNVCKSFPLFVIICFWRRRSETNERRSKTKQPNAFRRNRVSVQSSINQSISQPVNQSATECAIQSFMLQVPNASKNAPNSTPVLPNKSVNCGSTSRKEAIRCDIIVSIIKPATPPSPSSSSVPNSYPQRQLPLHSCPHHPFQPHQQVDQPKIRHRNPQLPTALPHDRASSPLRN